MYFSTPHLPEPQRGSQAGKQEFPLCKENAFRAAAPHPPAPRLPLPSHPFPSFPHYTLRGEENPGTARRLLLLSGELASYLESKGLKRPGLPAPESQDPREGGSFATSSLLPASLGHSHFPGLPFLSTPRTPRKCQAGSARAEPGSRSLTRARGPWRRRWHSRTQGGGGRASLCWPPPGGRACVGTARCSAGSCNDPGANSDVAPSTLALLSAAAALGLAGGGLGGAVPSARPGGGSRGPAGAGAKWEASQRQGWDG